MVTCPPEPLGHWKIMSVSSGNKRLWGALVHCKGGGTVNDRENGPSPPSLPLADAVSVPPPKKSGLSGAAYAPTAAVSLGVSGTADPSGASTVIAGPAGIGAKTAPGKIDWNVGVSMLPAKAGTNFADWPAGSCTYACPSITVHAPAGGRTLGSATAPLRRADAVSRLFSPNSAGLFTEAKNACPDPAGWIEPPGPIVSTFVSQTRPILAAPPLCNERRVSPLRPNTFGQLWPGAATAIVNGFETVDMAPLWTTTSPRTKQPVAIVDGSVKLIWSRPGYCEERPANDAGTVCPLRRTETL